MPTIKEIAKASGVSVATVSNIINEKGKVSEETRIRVQKIIEEMNYTPNSVAKNLKTKNSRCIGVIAEDMTVFALPDIIDGITEYCEKEDYQILLVNLRLYKKFEDTYYRSDRYGDIVQREIQKLVAKQVEGIIYVAAHERLINVFPEQLPVPMVVAYDYTSHRGIPSVMVSDEQGARELVKYLISMGHRRIGVIAGKKYSMHTRSRLEGYQRALFEENVTAIFCMNDFMAGGAYDRLDERKLKVGRDIAVAGYDNREMAGYEKPPLTTMGLPLHDIGYRASEIILDMLKKEEKNTEEADIYYVDCKPYIRQSVNQLKTEERRAYENCNNDCGQSLSGGTDR